VSEDQPPDGEDRDAEEGQQSEDDAKIVEAPALHVTDVLAAPANSAAATGTPEPTATAINELADDADQIRRQEDDAKRIKGLGAATVDALTPGASPAAPGASRHLRAEWVFVPRSGALCSRI
jgi:predicted flap endonuclease-1-like 5' DNA nuclease